MKAPRYTFTVGHGQYWYFRRGDFQRPLPASPGHPQFEIAYAKSLDEYARFLSGRAEARASRAGKADILRARLIAADPDRVGVVYCIGEAKGGGAVKIGFTSDLGARLDRLQSNSSRKLKLFAAFAGTVRDELSLHTRFRDVRLHGEWFKRTPDLMATVRSLAKREKRLA